MKKNAVEILVLGFFACFCAAVSFLLWSFAVRQGFKAFGLDDNRDFIVALGLLVVNAGHFFFGYFHTDENIGDVAPHNPGLMQNAFADDRVWIRIFAFFTIGFSQYVQDIVNILRASRAEEENKPEP